MTTLNGSDKRKYKTMKSRVILLAAVLLAAFSTAEAQKTTTTKKIKLQGVEQVETLSDDGTSIKKRPYRWFAGIAEADNEATAIEMAQLEAYANISRVIENIVSSQAERGTIVVNGKVDQALKSHWEQMSMSIQNACEPFGETEITYDSETKMYKVLAKVGIRGDRYVKILDNALNAKPEGLSGSDLKEFNEANKTIIDAAKDSE